MEHTGPRLNPLNDYLFLKVMGEKGDEAIQKAQERAAFVASDKEALREYHMREMALSDWTSGVNHARREGRKEAAQEIFSLLKSGKSIEEAEQLLGL